mmetsp:Transcript_88122/g.254321  ORF Transcript_88122/g.254321 Transcript_88122/m.254321 type:complete len:225 (+) Transcript_88122:878-1552(+)
MLALASINACIASVFPARVASSNGVVPSTSSVGEDMYNWLRKLSSSNEATLQKSNPEGKPSKRAVRNTEVHRHSCKRPSAKSLANLSLKSRRTTEDNRGRSSSQVKVPVPTASKTQSKGLTSSSKSCWRTRNTRGSVASKTRDKRSKRHQPRVFHDTRSNSCPSSCWTRGAKMKKCSHILTYTGNDDIACAMRMFASAVSTEDWLDANSPSASQRPTSGWGTEK